MKIYSKTITNCKECPEVSYEHFDGEGESCAYQYNYPFCNHRDIIKGRTWNNIPRVSVMIPNWCPLSNA